MLSIIYLFIMLTSFIIYKAMCEYQNFNKEKSTCSRLIYWGIVIFISAIFNVTLYINNTDNYKISFYLDKDNLHLIAFVLIMYLIIQVLSPTIFKGHITKLSKNLIEKMRSFKATKKLNKDNISSENMNLDLDIPSNKTGLNQYISNKNINLQESNFEIFLNTFCWLSFSYVIFIQIFFSAIDILQSYKVNFVLKESFIVNFANLQNNLTGIACFLMLLMIPVSLRQIIYYLFKLREDNSLENHDFLKNNPQYELIQKRLSKNNKRL